MKMRSDKIFSLVLFSDADSYPMCIVDFIERNFCSCNVDIISALSLTHVHRPTYTIIHAFMSGDLEGTGGTVPPKFEVGDGPCIRPPNILRSILEGSVE